MLRIGLTGGIGSGKSTVAKMFQQLGVPVFDADIIARQLVSPGETALEQIKAVFGKGVIDETGHLDRTELRQRVFNDAQLREKLDTILHPLIQQQLMLSMSQATTPYCIAVIPLLLEKGWQTQFDRVLVVDTPQAVQITRATQRDKVTKQQINAIMAAQVDRKTRLNAADDTINNTTSLAELQIQVEKLHQQYQLLSQQLNTPDK